jgi:predicted nucleotidyltransferase
LFGSRVDDTKKGGDIDLLVLVNSVDKSFFIESKIKVLKVIFEKLDEQKIDITVATEDELKSDVFLRSVSISMIELKNNI